MNTCEPNTSPQFPLPTGKAALRLGLKLIERGYEVLLYVPSWNAEKSKFDKKPVGGGSNHATRDAMELRRRFKAHPSAAIGIRRGHGVAIVDDDAYKLTELPSPTREARELLAEHDLVHSVPNFATASGGRHWYFSSLNLRGRKCAVPGIELLENNGFIAVSGELPPITELQPLPEEIVGAFTKAEAQQTVEREAPAEAEVPAGTIEQAQRVLAQMDPDCDYDTWIKLGMALENDLGEAGWDLWNDWSSKGSKYPGEEQLGTHWNSFGRSPSPVTLGSFLRQQASKPEDFADLSHFDPYEAEEKATANARRESVERSLTPYKFEPGRFEFIDYYVDGFIGNGLTVIGGGPGVGKTTLIVPLAAIAAGLFPATIKAEVRRRVVYLAEQPPQVADILAGLAKNVEGFRLDDVGYWFTIIPSRRKSHETMRDTIKLLRKQYRHEEGGRTAEPLIVLDTSNANIELESENDNAQVGRVIAAIKEELDTAACWLICHTPKAVGRADVEKLTMRGAFAFEGDCNQTAFVFLEEGVEDKRFMAVKKVRFEPEFWELEFHSSVGTVTVPGIDGRADQTRNYRYGVPVASSAAQRLAQRVGGKQGTDLETGEAIAAARAAIDAALAELAKRGIKATRGNIEALRSIKDKGGRVLKRDAWRRFFKVLEDNEDIRPAEKVGGVVQPVAFTPAGEARRAERDEGRREVAQVLDEGDEA